MLLSIPEQGSLSFAEPGRSGWGLILFWHAAAAAARQECTSWVHKTLHSAMRLLDQKKKAYAFFHELIDSVGCQVSKQLLTCMLALACKITEHDSARLALATTEAYQSCL